MIINYAYKFRLYPTEQQKVLLNKHFGCNRFIWNYFLNERQQYYLNNKEDIEAKRIKGYLNYYDNCAELTKLKKQDNYKWLNEVNSQSMQSTLKYLDIDYKSFFNKKSGFPKFKSKNSKQSFTIPQHLLIKDNKLYCPKFKDGIKIKQHREINGKFCVATLSKTNTNKYFISIIVEKEVQHMDKVEKVIGLDLGIKDFCVCSDGVVFENKKILSKYEKKLKRQQRIVSRRQKGSKRRELAKLKLAKIHEKIANIRKDYLHDISNKITNENQIICLEDLNVKGMVKNHILAKSINDCSWNEFINQLKYKSKIKGRQIVEIDRFFPSSQVCHCCGFQNTALTLKDREWTCPNCKKHLDRDLNASINILRQGLNKINADAIAVCGRGVSQVADYCEATSQNDLSFGS